MKSIQEFYQKIDAQFTKIITREFCRKVALSLLCRGNLLVEDTHDIAESRLLKAIADLLNTTYAEVQVTPETTDAVLEKAFSHGLVLLKGSDRTACRCLMVDVPCVVKLPRNVVRKKEESVVQRDMKIGCFGHFQKVIFGL